ncbi:MAG TPA: transglycosylase SLT domain-containing protein [Bryobacteraceae bacterium]|jgi:membrane-bound lytic murein transglycosylase D|nr:transglycosylase SLT domain-containing protein [Bryobacteraceae bacterium]
MTRKYNVTGAVVFAAVLLISSQSLYSQQSNIQASFLAPVAIRTPATAGIAATIADTEHLPYLKEVARENAPTPAAFQPTASDLLIQQAEERFRNGRKAFQERDFDRARTEFDAAIDTMLTASENPTDRRLFESKLEDMVDVIHRDDLSGMGAAAEDDVPAFDKAPLDDIVTMTFSVDPRIKNKVQSEIKNTTSALPLVVNDIVLGYINYFNTRGHKTIEAGMERAGKYSAMISKVLAEEGIPQELIHLAQAESGFLPRAVSRASAEGLWQFVKFRGNEYGLKQTPYSDERLDPEKATRAAAHHLHDLYNEFGDWYLAIAAYNCGPGAVEKAVERTGYADFWELRARRALPTETTNYVPIILAMTIMAKNAPEYGLENVTPDPAVEYDTIMTTSPTSLTLIGDLSDTPVSELVQLNPALLRGIAPGNFEVRVPKGTAAQVTAGLDLVPTSMLASSRIHRVEPGQSLTSIARLYNVSITQLAAANNLKDSEPSEGDRLVVPAAYHEVVPALRTPRLAGTHAARTSVRSRTASAKSTAVRSGAVRAAAGRKPATTASAKRPLHSTSGTLAQLKEHNAASLIR